MPEITSSSDPSMPWSARDSLGHEVWNRVQSTGMMTRMGSLAVSGGLTAIHDRHQSFVESLGTRPFGASSRRVPDDRILRLAAYRPPPASILFAGRSEANWDWPSIDAGVMEQARSQSSIAARSTRHVELSRLSRSRGQLHSPEPTWAPVAAFAPEIVDHTIALSAPVSRMLTLNRDAPGLVPRDKSFALAVDLAAMPESGEARSDPIRSDLIWRDPQPNGPQDRTWHEMAARANAETQRGATREPTPFSPTPDVRTDAARDSNAGVASGPHGLGSAPASTASGRTFSDSGWSAQSDAAQRPDAAAASGEPGSDRAQRSAAASSPSFGGSPPDLRADAAQAPGDGGTPVEAGPAQAREPAPSGPSLARPTLNVGAYGALGRRDSVAPREPGPATAQESTTSNTLSVGPGLVATRPLIARPIVAESAVWTERWPSLSLHPAPVTAILTGLTRSDRATSDERGLLPDLPWPPGARVFLAAPTVRSRHRFPVQAQVMVSPATDLRGSGGNGLSPACSPTVVQGTADMPAHPAAAPAVRSMASFAISQDSFVARTQVRNDAGRAMAWPDSGVAAPILDVSIGTVSLLPRRHPADLGTAGSLADFVLRQHTPRRTQPSSQPARTTRTQHLSFSEDESSPRLTDGLLPQPAHAPSAHAPVSGSAIGSEPALDLVHRSPDAANADRLTGVEPTTALRLSDYTASILPGSGHSQAATRLARTLTGTPILPAISLQTGPLLTSRQIGENRQIGAAMTLRSQRRPEYVGWGSFADGMIVRSGLGSPGSGTLLKRLLQRSEPTLATQHPIVLSRAMQAPFAQPAVPMSLLARLFVSRSPGRDITSASVGHGQPGASFGPPGPTGERVAWDWAQETLPLARLAHRLSAGWPESARPTILASARRTDGMAPVGVAWPHVRPGEPRNATQPEWARDSLPLMRLARSTRITSDTVATMIQSQSPDATSLMSRQDSLAVHMPTGSADSLVPPTNFQPRGISPQAQKSADGRSDAPDLEDLVERAWSALMLRLTIEHERRGFGRWS
jgi:hypothetical protein